MKDNHHPFYATYVYCIYVCICHLGIHDYIYIYAPRGCCYSFRLSPLWVMASKHDGHVLV